MKRILQLLSGVMVALVIVLGWRTLDVARIQPPVFPDPPQTALANPLPPSPRKASGNTPVVRAIIDGNLFETERGKKPKPAATEEVQAPLPPPTNIVLNGVFMVPKEPVAIMTDKKSGARQRGLRTGDMIGDYEIGDIASRRVTLLGAGGQRFTVRLQTKKGSGTTAPASARPGRPVPPRPPSARAARPPVERGTAARATTAPKPPSRARSGAPKPATPDPAQARLEALKKLREAANRR